MINMNQSQNQVSKLFSALIGSIALVLHMLIVLNDFHDFAYFDCVKECSQFRHVGG